MITKQASALGGRARTGAKLSALAALHAARRGVRVNKPGITEHELHGLLADVQELVREPDRSGRSMRGLSRYCGVDIRTVLRWLDGTDWPPSPRVAKMRAWARRMRAN